MGGFLDTPAECTMVKNVIIAVFQPSGRGLGSRHIARSGLEESYDVVVIPSKLQGVPFKADPLSQRRLPGDGHIASV